MKILKNAVLLIVVLSAHSCAALADSTDKVEKSQPNFVMIVIDDLRPVIGAYGDEKAHTPNIDKLASKGIMFNRAYANVPVCGASRANQMRFHLGYHYPRSIKTTNEINDLMKKMEQALIPKTI